MSNLFSEDSFDRFGDDLCQLVLSYLPFEQRFRFECVSKHFQRNVFAGERELIIEDKHMLNASDCIDWSMFETILRKCPHVRIANLKNCHLYCRNDDIIDLLVNNCHKLTEFYYCFLQMTAKNVDKIFAKYGPQLEFVSLGTALDASNLLVFRQTLKLCYRLRRLNVKNVFLSHIIDDTAIGGQCVVSGLRQIEFMFRNDDTERFQRVIARNRSLRAVHVICSELTPTAAKSLIHSLCQLTSLVCLEITYYNEWCGHQVHDVIANPALDDTFVNISRNCPQLKSLCLRVSPEPSLLYKTFDTIKHFQHLRRLEISFDVSEDDGSLDCQSLKCLKRLTHLTINSYNYGYNQVINDRFFADIDHNLPKLQSLCVSYALITDLTLNSLQKLSNLETIKFFKTKLTFTEPAVKEFMANTPKLKCVHNSP